MNIYAIMLILLFPMKERAPSPNNQQGEEDTPKNSKLREMLVQHSLARSGVWLGSGLTMTALGKVLGDEGFYTAGVTITTLAISELFLGLRFPKE